MNTSLLISVIIPARNAASSLSETLTSVLNQSLPKSRYEIIVVDNASSDETSAIANSFSVRCIFEPRMSRAVARNTGIQASIAPLVAFIDADTIIKNDWLEKLSAALRDETIGGIQGILQFTATDSGYRNLQFEIGNFKHLSFLFTGACMYRRIALKEAGYFTESLLRHEDVDLSFKVLLQGWKIASTTSTFASTPACQTVRLGSQIAIGAAMVQIIDRWQHLFGYSSWSGIQQTLSTWWRQYKFDPTTRQTISLARCIARSTALIFYGLFFSENPVQISHTPQRLPDIYCHNKILGWTSGARVIYTELTTKLVDIFEDTLIIIEGSGDLFMKLLFQHNGLFEDAIHELQTMYGHTDTIRDDMTELLHTLINAQLLIDKTE